MEMSTRSGNHEPEDFSDLSKVEGKSYQFPLKQNNYTELLGYSEFKFRLKVVPQTPADPKLEFFP